MVTKRALFLVLVLLGSCKDDIGEGLGGEAVEAPANLAAIVLDGGMEVALTWADNASNETGYRVEINDAPFGTPPYVDLITLSADTISYTARSEPNRTWYFRVSAITSNSQSEPSNVVSVTTPDVPFPPAHFAALATGPLVVELRWISGAGSTGNRIERSADGGVSWLTVFLYATPVGVYGFNDSVQTAANKAYLYRMQSIGINGPSGYSFADSTTQTTPIATRSIPMVDGGSRTSLAISPFGIAHISHYDNSVSNLFHTTGHLQTGYTTAMIDNGGSVANFSVGYHGTSIALDGAGKVHVAANEYWSDSLRYVTNAGGLFTATMIDAKGGKSPQIRFSPYDGTLQIVYKSEGDVELTRAVRAGSGTWTFDTLPIRTIPEAVHGFAIDAQGIAHVVLVNDKNHLWHARNPGSGWELALISDQGLPDYPSLAIGPSGTLHAAYHDAATGWLMYAMSSGGAAWTTEKIHSYTGGNLGTFNSIAVNQSTGAIHVAYYNSVHKDLWVARKASGGTWKRNLLDSAGDVGRYTSIAWNPTSILELLTIAYYDATNGDLKIIVHGPWAQ